jgi:exodeoxyribonuclease III
MRLATWNCQTGLDSNWDELDKLHADVLTVQECGPKTEEQARERGWASSWLNGGWDKGIAVLARPTCAIEPSESPDRFFISTVVTEPEHFRFVAFWAMTPRYAKYSYTRQATRLIEWLPADGLPTVVAGDFNASKSIAHLRNVARLGERGLASAYHRYHRVRHEDKEAHPTSYWLWSAERPFHMDFIFIPTDWDIESVDIGTFDDFPARGLSDHVPVAVTVRPP